MNDIAPSPSSQGIFILAGLWCLVVLSSVLAPRFVPSDAGPASGATATLVFLALLSLAALIAVWLLLQTLPRFRRLSTAARIAGIVPCVLNLGALAWVWFGLAY